MEKIRLKDGTEYNIAAGATENLISIPITETSELTTIYATMTNDNLSEFSVLTEGDAVCAIITNKKVAFAGIVENDSTYVAVFRLEKVDNTELQLSSLQNQIDEVVSVIVPDILDLL